MQVCAEQLSSPGCLSVWFWFLFSPKCWVSTVWSWPFTCTPNKSNVCIVMLSNNKNNIYFMFLSSNIFNVLFVWSSISFDNIQFWNFEIKKILVFHRRQSTYKTKKYLERQTFFTFWIDRFTEIISFLKSHFRDRLKLMLFLQSLKMRCFIYLNWFVQEPL